jgi:hypothetical protein
MRAKEEPEGKPGLSKRSADRVRADCQPGSRSRHAVKLTRAQLKTRCEETARRYARCMKLTKGEHDLRLAAIRFNVFRALFPVEGFPELHAAEFVVISECRNCNTFSVGPVGRDMQVMSA